jgi:uncharacterized membrane protein YgcG
MIDANAHHIATVISQATAPAFVLGAVAGFISIIVSRLNRVMDRVHDLSAVSDTDERRASERKEVPRLKRRAELLNQSIILAVFSAIVAAVIVLIAFLSALVGLEHEYGVALLFIVALGLLVASLVKFAAEVRMTLKDDSFV